MSQGSTLSNLHIGRLPHSHGRRPFLTMESTPLDLRLLSGTSCPSPNARYHGGEATCSVPSTMVGPARLLTVSRIPQRSQGGCPDQDQLLGLRGHDMIYQFCFANSGQGGSRRG